MNKNNIRYVFFYPSLTIGGAQLLFARMAEALISSGKEVLILENEQSFIHEFLIGKNLEFEFYQVSKTKKFKLEEGDLLVLSLSYILLYEQFIEPHKNSRLVFWDLHPYALIEATALSKVHKEFPYSWVSIMSRYIEFNFIKKIKTFVTVAHNHDAIYFMCLRNFNTNKELFNLQIKPTYLPIPITPVNDFNKNIKDIDNNKKKNPNLVRIGWISRMETDKVAILELLIEDISQFNMKNIDYKVQLHAIGKGDAFDKVIIAQTALGDMLKLPGVLYGADLDNYISDNIDVGFSMGTSALEFAIRNVATVLVPSATLYKLCNSEKRRYLWLHDSLGFDVAVEQFHLNYSSKNFEIIMTEFKNERNILANNSYEYVNYNHSFSNIFDKFLKHTNSSTFTYANLSEIDISNNGIFQNLLFYLKKNIKNRLFLMVY